MSGERPQYVDRKELRAAVNPIIGHWHANFATGTNDIDLVGGALTVPTDEETPCPIRGTMRNLRVRVSSNAANTNSSFTLRKNGVNTALSATITALTNGVFADLVNAVDVEPGDLLLMRIVVGGVAQSLRLNAWSLLLEPKGIQ